MSVLTELDIDLIVSNPRNPRKTFDPQRLSELATSIQAVGVLQPIRVERLEDGRYMIQHGERRWRAAKEAGLETMPAIVDAPSSEDDELLVRALIENLGREDLNPVDEGSVYKELLEMGWTQTKIARVTGRSLYSISGRLAWLDLEPEIQALAKQGLLPMTSALPMALRDKLPPEVRVPLAQKMADVSLNLKACMMAIDKAAQKVANQKVASRPKRTYYRESSLPPMMRQAGFDDEEDGPEVSGSVYNAARAMCQKCNWKPRKIIPSWELVRDVAEEICRDCQKRDGPAMPDVCRHCPGVEMLRALVSRTQGSRHD